MGDRRSREGGTRERRRGKVSRESPHLPSKVPPSPGEELSL